jgi:predicted dehydrogenase
MPDRIRWGVISTSNIARVAVIPAIQSSHNGIVLGVASRDKAKARDYADSLKIERAYGSYEEMLADPDIDAIYTSRGQELRFCKQLKTPGKGSAPKVVVGIN